MKTDADEMGFEATPNAPAADNHLSLDNQALSDKKPVLRYRERDIHIQNVHVNSDQTLVGQVCEISNVCSAQYEGLKLGQTISFRCQHIQHFA